MVLFYLKKIIFSIRNEWVIWWMSFIVRPWHMGGGWRQYTIFYYWIKEKRYYKTKTFDIYTLYDKSQASVKRFRSRFFAFPLTTQNSNQKNFFFSLTNELSWVMWQLVAYHIVYWGQFDFRGPKKIMIYEEKSWYLLWILRMIMGA